VIEGVLVFQMPISRINHIMQASANPAKPTSSAVTF